MPASDGARTIDYSTLEIDDPIAFDKFKEEYAFININVPQSLRAMFIDECVWFKDKIGDYPDHANQISILKSLVK